MKYKTLLPVIAGSLALSTAWAMDEVETNHPIGSAQELHFNSDSMSLDAWLGAGAGSTDLDFFAFWGNEGDVVTIDVDNGMGGSDSVDTVIGLFGPGPAFQLLYENDDEVLFAVPDSKIVNARLPVSGMYTVGVSSFPRYWMNGGNTYFSGGDTGDYSVTISGVSPMALSAMQVNIEIKPGSGDEMAPINPKSRGKVPVAILSHEGFDATKVDHKSLRFGHSGEEDSLHHCAKKGEDVNGDGLLDLVCHFNNQDAGWTVHDLEGHLSGEISGVAFEGHGLLKVVPGEKTMKTR